MVVVGGNTLDGAHAVLTLEQTTAHEWRIVIRKGVNPDTLLGGIPAEGINITDLAAAELRRALGR